MQQVAYQSEGFVLNVMISRPYASEHHDVVDQPGDALDAVQVALDAWRFSEVLTPGVGVSVQ
ncbi:hypothetical protein APY04_3093 [Hyphomicrobium sulfonivorans]|uniref:Uncharacterized protein n=1 Tax=Hyphomicrobium sulfonivorans TaxID=121290 RepID=A0A109B9V5_HYPSL|nr:hypothetical protein APY04_3093 [Hyphomicrobium sulfonivorans]